MSKQELSAKLSEAIEPAYGAHFTNHLLRLYDLPISNENASTSTTSRTSTSSTSTGSSANASASASSSPESFEAQRVYAEIITDATTLCPTLPLAKSMSRGPKRSAASNPLYMYATSQQPANRSGFCPLEPFQAIDNYCPLYSYHAIDMFSLFLPPYPTAAWADGDRTSAAAADPTTVLPPLPFSANQVLIPIPNAQLQATTVSWCWKNTLNSRLRARSTGGPCSPKTLPY